MINVRDIADAQQFFKMLEQCMYADQWRFRQQYKRLQQTHDAQKLAVLVEKLARSKKQREQRALKLPVIEYPELPVSDKRHDIAEAIEQHQVVIVAGETGSGKTTQLPKICLELGRGIGGIIAHTQPRRLAARSVANRIAEECGTQLGDSVGFKIRFSDQSSDNTLVKLMTDGILLAEIQHDKYLSQYDTIIIDEAHERSLNIDFLLGYLKQLLPKRPDLKVIITSATIDPERFSKHFNNAPIISVSGRTYPVDILYRPLGEDTQDSDLAQGIIEAVEELRTYPRGDILVFLSGEREIREVEQALVKARWAGTEIVPLYARLSASEQNKIFAPHSQRRIILSTNVAETSLTVPGIRYVIDPGYARISRYSYRSKVQRLPIEAISQASAQQRAGRCGRVADGVCIRLYSEEDFQSRPEFTDPEILRTNLASVILQMLSLGLGEIQSFPFVQPPDNRFITDGIRLLEELQAVSHTHRQLKLTALGRKLARLPIDPRYARMVIAAPEYNAFNEVAIITAGLSIQDPRERPREKQQKADEAHAEFADEDSDFISLYNLYVGFLEQQQALSNSQLRKWCKQHFIHYLRMREWQDIVSQIKSSSKDIIKPQSSQTPDYQGIHTALAHGLLSFVAMFDKNREYMGARNLKCRIFPGSPLAKKNPKWMLCAEMVETSFLFARNVARIDPQWLEPIALHLTKSSISEPYWSKKQGAAMALEKVTLFGLPIVPQRRINIGQREPVVARELFIREGLVTGLTKLNYAFLDANNALISEVESLENKTRRRDLLVSEDVIYDFYAQVIPANVVSEASFKKWFAKMGRDDDLRFEQSMLWRNKVGQREADNYPDTFTHGPFTLPLSYEFEPTSDKDGVSVYIPLGMLNQITETGFDWLVPGLRYDLIVHLIKSLPKSIRRNFVPVPEYANACLLELSPFDEKGEPQSLINALALKLFKMSGIKIDAELLHQAQLPLHCQMRFVICQDDGSEIASSRDLGQLQQMLQDQIQAQLDTMATPELEQDNLTEWSFGALPTTFTQKTAGFAVQGFPGLQVQKSSVSIKLFDREHEAKASHRQGLIKLISLALPSPIKYLHQKLPNKSKLGLYFNPFGKVNALIDDCIHCAIDHHLTQYCVEQGIDDVREPEQFAACCDEIRMHLNDTVLTIAMRVEVGLTIANAIKKHTKGNIPLTMLESISAIQGHLEQLVYPLFVSDIGYARLEHWQRYLKALERRIEKVKVDPTRDRQQQLQIDKANALYQKKCDSIQSHHVMPDTLLEVRWMIEELRVSLFAQQLGTQYPISLKRIEQALSQV